MKSKFLKFLPIVLSAAICGGVFAACGGNNPGNMGDDTSTPLAADNKIYLVGDSTVCSFNDDYYLPRYGYGTQIHNYFNVKENQVVNLALSGRSSWSFTYESNYNLLKNISAGDYLIIGFGHNDQKDNIYTNPNLATDSTEMVDGTITVDDVKQTVSHNASFKRSLYENYIKLAKDKGATPILCTPIVRLNDKNDYSGNSAHVRATSDGGKNPGGNWAQAIRDLGAEKNVDVVDLTAITKQDYTEKGYAEAAKYHAFTGAEWADAGKTVMQANLNTVDATHTNYYGAKMNAYHIANALKSSNNPIAKHVKTDIQKPTYESDYAKGVKQGFQIIEYSPFNPATSPKSMLGELKAEDWYSTAFGYMGAALSPQIASVTQNETQDGSLSITVAESGSKLKISSGQEGIVCAFTQLSSDATFSISAEVTINNYNEHAQTGFGIMLRDDIYIDKRDSAILSNYAAAGVYGLSTSANILYTRVNGALSAVNSSQTLDTSTSHTLSIVRSGKTVTVTFDGKSKSYDDFDIRVKDADNMYICLYASRGTSVTFNNVNLQVTGTSEA